MGSHDVKLDVEAGCSLWLADIGEPSNNDLRVVVLEARGAPKPEETIVGPATRIRPDEKSRGFELIWYGYVAYGIRNESYFRRETGEALSGHQLAVRTNSAFLSYVATTTFATDDYPGKLTHWSLYTDWHCIDVVGPEPPQVRQLDLAETGRYLNASKDGSSAIFSRFRGSPE